MSNTDIENISVTGTPIAAVVMINGVIYHRESSLKARQLTDEDCYRLMEIVRQPPTREEYLSGFRVDRIKIEAIRQWYESLHSANRG